MSNHYLDFITDDHLIRCIRNLHDAYLSAKQKISKKSFYKNKVDVFKLTFDAKFNGMTEEELIEAEVMRQIDKSINNSIGTFHEEILGGINGYEMGKLSGFDIKAEDNSLFADIKNKHNTMNSSAAEALFQKLSRYADDYKQAKCYWVQILAQKSFCEPWFSIINGKEYSHSRVYKISGDQFYALLTGQDDALSSLYRALPKAIDNFLATLPATQKMKESSVLQEIQADMDKSERQLIDQITFDNYRYYLDFENW